MSEMVPLEPFPDEGPCSFCQHLWAEHTGNATSPRGCAAAHCPEVPTPRLGRCALYTSAATAAKNATFFRLAETPVTLTPVQLANAIHRGRYGTGTHSMFMSCSCLHEAMALLGF